jgi:hypothetical protein
VIRSLLDIRLSRFSLAVLAAVSVLATVVIITAGNGHTAAQLTALAALHEPVAAQTRTVTVAAAPSTATTSDSPAAGDSGSSGSGSGDSSAASGSGSDSGSDSDAGSSDAGTDTGDSGDGGDDSTTPATTTTPTPASTLPKVHHVFEIALSTTSYAAAFADKPTAPYLHALEAKGTLLRGYQSLGHGELADYLAMISGQGPNAATSAGCTTYLEFRQGVVAKSNGLVPGAGCVYPETALTIGDQVTAKGATWKAYIADMGKQTCSHPNSGALDDAVLPDTESGYDTRHNPFIYFHSLLDLGDCASDDQDLSHLSSALAHKSTTAKLSYIAPDACEDAAATVASTVASSPTTGTSTTSTTSGETTPSAASETTTTTTSTTTSTSTTATATGTTTSGTTVTPSATVGCPADRPVGIAAEDAFLKQWVPRILASAAYKDDGVLILAFAGERGRHPGHVVRTGALVLSHYAKKGTVISKAYTPYSLLRSVEDMLGDTALAHAQAAPSFAQAILHKSL